MMKLRDPFVVSRMQKIWPFEHVLLLLIAAACSAVDSCPANGADNDEPRRARQTAWTTSRIQGTPEPPLPYKIERVYPSIRFDQTSSVRRLPGTDWILIADNTGTIKAFRHGDEQPVVESILDLRDRRLDPTGIVDLTFHPRFPDQPWCFLTYGTRPQSENGLVLARFRIELTDPPRVDPDTERVILTWPNIGHSGVCVRFGPDGYLYISIGDGAGPNPPDPRNTGQDVSDLLGSILRIDVDHSDGDRFYRVPADNPFTRMEGARGEIWAYGFRNPWKMCFEPNTGALWVADVGWDTFEMVYRVVKGGNYGWSVMEGSRSVRSDLQPGPTPILPPTVEHSHLEARSITGGEFYHGSRLPELDGALIYGDWQTGKVWGLKHDGRKVTYHEELVDSPLQIVCFFVDPDREIVIVGYDGTMYRLIRNRGAVKYESFPRRLSDTGLFASAADHHPATGVVPYWIVAEPWADGTTAQRFVALPDRSQMTVFKESNWEVGQVKGYISFPENAVLAKTIFLEMESGNPASRRRIETQILHRHGDVFNAYNYVWNDAQTDAVLADRRGMDQSFTIRDTDAPTGTRRRTWHHAGRNECMLCHVWSQGSVLGFKLHQLNRPYAHGQGPANQLDRFEQIGLFTESLPDDLPTQISPDDEGAPLEDRARAYLDVNCSQCHRSEGGGLAYFDIRETLALEETKLINAKLMQGDFGIQDARVVVPGEPHRSILYFRMAKLGQGRMPHAGSNVVDTGGLRLIRKWILSLGDQDKKSNDKRDLAVEQSIATLESDASLDKATLESLVESILATPSGAMQLVGAMDDDRLARSIRQKTIRIAYDHDDTRIRDLFERFVPETERTKRLGTDFDLVALANTRGDAQRGEQLFLESNTLSCKNCHPINGVGKNVGPDLRDVGRRYSKLQILDQIVFPSKEIDPKYQTHQVETTEGRIVGGLLVSETEKMLLLRDAAGNDIRIPRGEIEYRARHAKSLMPDQQLRELTKQQAVDLLEFLASLKDSSQPAARAR